MNGDQEVEAIIPTSQTGGPAPEQMDVFIGAKIIRAAEMSKAACHNDVLHRPLAGGDEDGYLGRIRLSELFFGNYKLIEKTFNYGIL